MAKGCDRCVVWEDERGRHHQPDCPEMFFASGARRGITPPAELARFGKLGSAMTLQDELAGIFAAAGVVTTEEEPDAAQA